MSPSPPQADDDARRVRRARGLIAAAGAGFGLISLAVADDPPAVLVCALLSMCLLLLALRASARWLLRVEQLLTDWP